MSDMLGRAAIVIVMWLVIWAVVTALGYTLTFQSFAGAALGFVLNETVRAIALGRRP